MAYVETWPRKAVGGSETLGSGSGPQSTDKALTGVRWPLYP
jgi:hypothetical protein